MWFDILCTSSAKRYYAKNNHLSFTCQLFPAYLSY